MMKTRIFTAKKRCFYRVFRILFKTADRRNALLNSRASKTVAAFIFALCSPIIVLVSIPVIELHARSAFSFLRGACVPEEYAEQCAALDQPAMALVDFDGVYGAPRFHLAMKKKNLTAYLGAEVLCMDGARYPLLIRSRTGYQNLCRMITRMKLRTGKHPKPGQEAAATLDE